MHCNRHPFASMVQRVAACAALAASGQFAWSGDAPERLSLRERETLFGDTGGGRLGLAESGLAWEATYTGEYFHNLGGGIRRGGGYRGDASVTLDLDTEKAGWWKHGEFFLHLQGQHGNGITERHAGDFQTLSNIDADDYLQISEFWYKHTFLEGKLTLKLGKMEANEDFAYAEYAGEFLNSSAGFSPTIPLVTYPNQDWGIVLGIEPADWFSMNAGIYQGRPDGGCSVFNSFDNLYGPMAMVEPAFHYNFRGHEGHLRLGFWWNGDRFDKLAPEEDGELRASVANGRVFLAAGESGRLATALTDALLGELSAQFSSRIVKSVLGDSDTQNGTRGFYATLDQELWKENPDDAEDEQGLGLFLQYGRSDAEVSAARQYYGGGLQWTGPFKGRDDDVLGIGAFHVDLSRKAGFEQSGETAIELFYRAQLAPWISAKPDLQYIVNPGGTNNRDAFAIGLRTEISF